jgi:branched-chain amino acid transport system ATP-binding protein
MPTMAAAEPMLELRQLGVRYGRVSAVRALSLEVRRGEIVGLIGPNGAGKSTTLHAIMGLVPTHEGDVLLAGRSVRGQAPETVARSGMALVPEGRRIFAELTVEENLRLGLSGRRERAGAEDAVDAVHELFPVVKEFRRRPAGALSGGQQQQLAIARALVAGPDVLLLDEPSLGLAPRMVEVVFEALAETRRRGISVLLVEQRAQRTVAFADRTYLVANGEQRLTLTPEDADDTERMVAAYLS